MSQTAEPHTPPHDKSLASSEELKSLPAISLNWEQAIDDLNFGLAITRPDLRALRVNKAACRMLGINQHDLSRGIIPQLYISGPNEQAISYDQTSLLQELSQANLIENAVYRISSNPDIPGYV